MEIIKQNININKKSAKEITQILLEGDIIVPDTKPDIESILETEENAYISIKDISNERISFKGSIDINVLYASKSDNKLAQCMSIDSPINDYISIDSAKEGMLATAKCVISNVEYKVINDRKINYRAVCDIEVEIIENETVDAITDIEGIDENQIKKSKYKINNLVCFKDDKFIIKDEISIPGGRPNIGEILGCRILIANKDVTLGRDKANISGTLKLATIYRGEEEDTVINFIENEISFNGSVELEGAEEGMLAEYSLAIQEKFIEAAQDDDSENRVISIEVTIGCNIKAYNENELVLFDDGYCINQAIDTERKSLTYSNFICKNKNQFPIKDIIQLDDTAESILQIIKASGNVYMDDVKIIEDKVIVEGIIKSSILYIANSDEKPICCYNAIIPYKQTIEAKGAKDGNVNYVNIDVSAEHISVNMLSDKEIELRCVINFDTCVLEEKNFDVVTGILFSDIDKEILDKIPSMTIYVVQKGDTLWKLAKKYNTSIEDIARLNDIENSDLIYPNQKLLILKRIE